MSQISFDVIHIICFLVWPMWRYFAFHSQQLVENGCLYSVHIADKNRICGVLISVLALRAIWPGFEPESGQIKYYGTCICCVFAKQAAFRSKSWLDPIRNNESEWRDMSTHGLLFQWGNSINVQLKRAGLMQTGHHYNHL